MPEIVWTGVYVAGALLLCAAFAAAPLSTIGRMFFVKLGEPRKQQVLSDIPDAPLIAPPPAANDDEISGTERRPSPRSGGMLP